MKKELQLKINTEVLNSWEHAKKVWNTIPDNATITQIDHCQCGYIIWGSYIFLVSYSTMVAYIQGDGVLFDILRLVYGYTATSAKHIAKFRNKFHHVSEKNIQDG